MADHARQPQPVSGLSLLFEIAPVAKLGIGSDGVARYLVKSDILRAEFHRRGDDNRMAQPIRIFQSPAHNLHATETAANDGSPLTDTELVRQSGLTFYPVSDPQRWEIRSPGLTGIRVDGYGAGATVTATDIIRTDDKKTAGIEGFSRSDMIVPPTRPLIGHTVISGGVVVATEGVTNEDGVAAIGVQFPIGFHHQCVIVECSAAGKRERLIEVNRLRCDNTNGVFRNYIRHQ